MQAKLKLLAQYQEIMGTQKEEEPTPLTRSDCEKATLPLPVNWLIVICDHDDDGGFTPSRGHTKRMEVISYRVTPDGEPHARIRKPGEETFFEISLYEENLYHTAEEAGRALNNVFLEVQQRDIQPLYTALCIELLPFLLAKVPDDN